MSISAVVGRIDQILQLQQQILDPASLAGSSATSGATGTSGTTGASFSTGTAATSSGMSTDFASQLASAQASAAFTTFELAS